MALLTIEPAPASAPTVNVAVIVRVSPNASVPRLQGNGVVQAPGVRDERQAGRRGIARRSRPARPQGPTFVTVSTYEIVSPGRAAASPLFVIDRSADAGFTTVVALALLLARIDIGRGGGDRRRVEDRFGPVYPDGTANVVSDGTGLARGNRAERARKCRRAGAGVSHERHAARRRIRHRDAGRVARPVVRHVNLRRSRCPGVSRSQARSSRSTTSRRRSGDRRRYRCLVVGQILIGHSRRDSRRVGNGIGRRIAGRNSEGRGDLAALACRNRSKSTRERRRACARVADERQPRRRRIRQRSQRSHRECRCW